MAEASTTWGKETNRRAFRLVFDETLSTNRRSNKKR